jgi:hypothetical protein
VQGQLDEASKEYRRAIQLEPGYAEAHCNLGVVLRRQGQFAASLEAYRQGHEYGSKNPRWPYPSAQWVKEAERLLELDGKLTAILDGKEKPADDVQRLALAQLCQEPFKKLYAASVHLYAEAIANGAKLANDMQAQHRYNAACAAALAAAGQGQDAAGPKDRERARLRQQALDWLQADLAGWRKLLEKDADKARPAVAQTMQHWLADPDFAAVRGREALAKLPEAEYLEWQKLWQEVEVLRQSAASPPKQANPARP